MWDYVINGPSTSRQSTTIGDVNYDSAEHTILGLHANKGITFDLAAIRRATRYERLELRALAGYGGAKGAYRADLGVYQDGIKRFGQTGLTAENQGQEIQIDLPPSARFLTFVATDGGNGYSHDQV